MRSNEYSINSNISVCLQVQDPGQKWNRKLPGVRHEPGTGTAPNDGEWGRGRAEGEPAQVGRGGDGDGDGRGDADENIDDEDDDDRGVEGFWWEI